MHTPWTWHITLRCANSLTQVSSQQRFKRDVSSQMLLIVKFLCKRFPSHPCTQAHRALGVPLLFCVLWVSETLTICGRMPRVCSGILHMAPPPPTPWFMLIPCFFWNVDPSLDQASTGLLPDSSCYQSAVWQVLFGCSVLLLHVLNKQMLSNQKS